MHKKMYVKFIKRTMDFIVSFIALILLLPFIILITIAIRIKLGKPVFFKQERPGLNGKVFIMYKFRTMTNERDNNGNLLSDNLRLNGFGKFLRASSIDELPELINILIGEMSLVGPRPLLVDYLPRYNDLQKRRHEVKPGLTGLSQINGRNLLTWEEKFSFDIYYVDNLSFLLDMKIILKTFLKIFSKSGVNKSDDVTMEAFLGNMTYEGDQK